VRYQAQPLLRLAQPDNDHLTVVREIESELVSLPLQVRGHVPKLRILRVRHTFHVHRAERDQVG
jgi:hypothetical protein